jgi:hypothetical protein
VPDEGARSGAFVVFEAVVMLAPSAAAAAIRVFRLAGVGIGAGVLVAGAVGGIGGRIAMRILFRAIRTRPGSGPSPRTATRSV